MPTSNDPAGIRAEEARRGVAAAVAVARAHGIRVDDATVLNDSFSLMVHQRPAPIVARVPTWVRRLRPAYGDHLRRELDVTSYLTAQGVPAVAPSPELPPGPHPYEGRLLSFWTYLEADPDRTVTNADCSAMLVDLHAALRAYPGELPGLVPAIIDTATWLPMLSHEEDVLTAADVDLLHATAERLDPLLRDTDASAQPLHGDVHPGNLVATRSGPVWIDFEDICRGPVEWDLASFDSAGELAAHHRPDPALLELCDQARSLQVALCFAGLYDVLGDSDSWDGVLRYCVDSLRAGARDKGPR